MCLVADAAQLRRLGGGGLAALVDAGVDQVQVRERALEGAALLAVVDAACRAVRSATRRRARVLVNRYVDVALAAGADGVHLGFDAMRAADARALLGEAAPIGVSCHAVEETRAAPGASYAHLAPIFAPLSKPSERPPLGTAALARARGGIPVLAQGGIEAGNAAACIAAGAAGVAVTGSLLGGHDTIPAARALRAALDAARSPS